MIKQKRKGTLLATLCLAVTLAVPGMASANGIKDISGHWAERQINDWVSKGLAKGYQDGSFKPNDKITRAEFMTLVNKAFGFTQTADIVFSDVPASKWFYEEIAKAKAAGYISGYQDGTIKPNHNISRQEVASILSVILKLDSNSSIQFSDSNRIPAWSKNAISAVVANGIMKGYPDGSYQASRFITRAEAIATLDQAVKAVAGEKPGETPATPNVSATTYDKAGTYGPEKDSQTINGDVVISAGDVILQNTVINGKLVIAESVNERDVSLKNVTVNGETVIQGGATINLDGIFTQVEVAAAGVSVKIEKGTVESFTVSKEAISTKLNVAEGTTINELILEVSTQVTGTGKIEKTTKKYSSGGGGGSSSSGNVLPPPETKPVDPIMTFNNGVQLNLGSLPVPAGATVTVTEKSPSIAPNAGVAVAGKVVDFQFEGMTISSPVQIALPISDGVDTSKVGIYYLNETNNQWEYQPSTVEGGVVKANVNHFSTYGAITNDKPVVDAASVQSFDVSVTEGKTGSVTLPLTDIQYITQGTITVPEAATLTLTSVKGQNNSEVIALLAGKTTQELNKGSNSLDIIEYLANLDPQDNGVSLGFLRTYFGSGVTIKGELKDNTGLPTEVQLVINF